MGKNRFACLAETADGLVCGDQSTSPTLLLNVSLLTASDCLLRGLEVTLASKSNIRCDAADFT